MLTRWLLDGLILLGLWVASLYMARLVRRMRLADPAVSSASVGWWETRAARAAGDGE